MGARRHRLRLLRPRRQLVYVGLVVSGLVIEFILLAFFLDRMHMLVEALLSERLINPVGAEVLFKALADARYILLGSSLFLVLIGAWVGLTLTQRIYGPVVAFLRHVGRLREGDYASRVHLRRGDDLHDLRDALNDLADTLERR